MVLETGRELAEAYRKQGRCEEAAQGLHGALALQVPAIGADHALLGDERRLEEGQAADVVEVKMAEEDVDLVGGVPAELHP